MGGKYRAVLTTAMLCAWLAALPADAAEPPPVATPGGGVGTVTLITGDLVSFQGERAVGVRMAKGREHVRYWQYRLNGHDHVVPDDAIRLVKQDKLDKRLFDITGLVQQEYDDAHQPNVPTIVTGAAGARAAQGLTVVNTPKSEAANVWRNQNQARAAAPRKIWLNGRVRANLDQSVRQIGAPTAWQAGLRADGVKVAVLDTGYDSTHPDLKSTVENAVDFTPEGDATKDVVGHGTHVASTIAGSGAASDGRYKGVAPGAKLLVGKVLTEYGGQEDWIIAGMQWAVQQGAKVINMSLGGGPTDGTDLMSQTVNELSAASGALFVIAAGNYGAPGSVGTPGSADRALTVGSVTKSDELSTFSSRGPRIGDYGLKPEIAAPGSDIIAARAVGTFTYNSVNEHYTRISGTSMATPHVAGAAAILAGQHPDWTGEQIKNTLAGSAKRLPGIDTFAQGAGRLDIARGVTQQVRAEGLAAFGEIWGKQDVARKVTYINDSTKPVTLKLDIDVRGKDGKPSNLFTVDKSVTVPTKSSATVTATAHAAAQPNGEFSGTIRAQAGDIVLNTPLTASLPGDKHTLRVKVPSRDGDPFVALVIVQNEETGADQGFFTENGTAELTVPAGRYRILGRIQDPSYADTMFVLPTTQVDKDTELAVDTKQGKKITVGIDDPAAQAQFGGGHGLMSDVDESGPMPGTGLIRPGVPTDEFPLYTIGGPRLRGLAFSSLSYWTHPWAVTTVEGAGGYVFKDSYVPWDVDQDKLTGRLVDVGEADPDSINRAGDVTGAIAIIVPKDWSTPFYPPGPQLRDGIELLKAKGARAVLSFFNPLYDLPGDAPPPALPTILAFNRSDLQGAQELMKQRPVEVTVALRPNSPVAYFLSNTVHGAVPTGHDFRFRKDSLGRVERQLVDTMAKGQYRYQFATWTAAGLIAGADVETKWPQRRTDYVSAGESFSLSGAAGYIATGDFGYETTIPVTLKAGEQRTSRMFAAPFGPELMTPPNSRQDGKPLPWAYRQGDRLNLAIPMFADSDPAIAGQFDQTNLGNTVLLKDGKEIGRRNDRPALGMFDLPRGPGRFQLIVDANRPESAKQVPALSTRTKAEWSFRADAGSDRREALPLLDIRYDLPLDDHNTAEAGKSLTGKVTAAHQPGARQSWIRELSVEVSYDEGATWQRAKVAGDRLEIPAGQGAFASLRATARDIAGNSVTETVIRAYALR